MAGGLAWAGAAGLAAVEGRPAVEATQSCCSTLALDCHWLTGPSEALTAATASA